jgi:glucose-1-phosphate cytidylyltransferase
MKAVILAGGKGTRFAEETSFKPKPLIEAASQPLIWHIMQNYSRFGITEFIVLAGYKGHKLREYFASYWLHQKNITFDLSAPNHVVNEPLTLPWKVSVIDTGIETQTGSRIAQLKDLLKEDFLLTYGDGVSDVNIEELVELHNTNNGIVTLTAVQPPARFGALNLDGIKVTNFEEKPNGDGAWVNGGFFVVSPEIFGFLKQDDCSLERDVLPIISSLNKLFAYKHEGYWQPVDTIRDLARLEEAIGKGVLPWT